METGSIISAELRLRVRGARRREASFFKIFQNRAVATSQTCMLGFTACACADFRDRVGDIFLFSGSNSVQLVRIELADS
jgi:hypothetical protein